MTPERWNKIKALFSSANDCPVEKRDEFLDEACKGDEELKREIERLLDSYGKDDGFLEDQAVAEVANIFAGYPTTKSGSSPQFSAGAVLQERYEIVRLLGRGGMGEVYLADDRRINRSVAIKVLHSDLVSNKESLRRFALEAQAVSALNHPHIVTIYEFDSIDDGTLFFVTEYVEGQPLNKRIGDGLSLEKSLDIAIQVASALSTAHDAGITHRDIKPENIMVRSDGYIKVLDFGLAKLHQRKASNRTSGSEDPTRALHRTRPGEVMGTAAYMSPEQARGLHVDARTDIWSLGVVLYEMITGKRPFSGETHADIIVSLLSTEPEPLSSRVSDLPAEIEWTVTKALSKDVEGRYQTMKGLRSDLERIKKQCELADSLGRSVKDLERVADDGDSPRGVPTAGQPARKTSGGSDDAAGLARFWSSPGFASAISQAGTHKIRSFALVVTLIALLSTGIYLGFFADDRHRIDSVAVLPFTDLSGGEMSYVAEGLSEGVIDRLSQLPQLKVISRNSSFKFRAPDVDVRAAAEQLGVRAIVTGSVQKVGDEIIVRIDITDAGEDRQLGGGQFRRNAAELEVVRNEIALTAAEQFRISLADGQTRRLIDIETENSEAYRYYLNGLVALDGTGKGRARARAHFEKAIEIDPQFALAYAEIAWIHWGDANASSDPSKVMPLARAAAEKALALNNELAKAHVVRAVVHEYEFDWKSAESEYRRAIELSPNMDFARNNYAFFLSVLDRQDEALIQLEEQRVRDPLNQRMLLLQKAIVLVQARRFDEALKVYSDAQVVEPSKGVPEFALGYAYAGKGLQNEAISYYLKAVSDLGGENEYSQPLVYLVIAYAGLPERRDEARAILKRIEEMDDYVSPALLAAVYSAFGDNDKAMELLERAFIEHDLLLRYAKTGYEYDGVRKDPRFVDLMKRTGLEL